MHRFPGRMPRAALVISRERDVADEVGTHHGSLRIIHAMGRSLNTM